MKGIVHPLLVGRIVWRDLLHGRTSAILLSLAVTAALLPLLLLYGLRSGIVDNMIEELRSNPGTREIVIMREASPGLAPGWFDSMATDPRVGFLLPRTLHLASPVEMKGPASRTYLEGRMLPTAAGDPLLTGKTVPIGLEKVAITDRVARRAGVKPGDLLEVSVRRNVGDSSQVRTVEMAVVAVLEGGVLQTDDILVDGAFEQAVERWRLGFAVPELGWPAAREDMPPQAGQRSFPGFRLYARDVRDVPSLRDMLVGMGLNVRTASAQIERALLIESGLGWVFRTVAAMSGLGFLLTLALHLLASVTEKIREFSVLRLLGMSATDLALLPSLQGIVIAGAGAVLASALALLSQPQINILLDGMAGLNGDVSRVTVTHVACGIGASLLVGAVAGVIAGLKVARLEPAAGLRRD